MKMLAGVFLYGLFFGFLPWAFFSYLPWWAAVIANLGVSGLVMGMMVNAAKTPHNPQPVPIPEALSDLLGVDEAPKSNRYH